MQLNENNSSPFPGERLTRGASRPEQDKLDANEAITGGSKYIQERASKRAKVSPYRQNLAVFNGLSADRPRFKII